MSFEFGKILILMGAFLILIGVVLMLGSKIPFLGRLPGDIHYERGSFKLFFPVTTCLLLSAVLTLLLWLISYLMHR